MGITFEACKSFTMSPVLESRVRLDGTLRHHGNSVHECVSVALVDAVPVYAGRVRGHHVMHVNHHCVVLTHLRDN